MSHQSRVLVPAFVLAMLAGGADRPISLIERANEAYREGRLQRALEFYEEADELRPDDPEILYNWATALTSSDDRGLADRLFRKADKLARSDELRARARLNLSHSLFVTASKFASVDPRQAVELFDESAATARAAWVLDRSNLDAARQVETSRLAAQMIRDQLRLGERLQELSRDQRSEAQSSAESARRQEERQAPATTEEQEPPQSEEMAPQQEQQATQPEQAQGQQKAGEQSPDQRAPGESPERAIDLPGFIEDLLNADRRRPPEINQQAEGQSPPPPPSDAPQNEPPNPPDGPGRDEGPAESPAPNPGEGPPESPSPETPPTGDGVPPRGLGETAADPEGVSGEPSGGASAGQRELSAETERLAQTLRKAMEEDLVAGDREFAEAVLRAIEEARKSQSSAEDLLETAQMEEASGAQEQAASLLELAQRMMNRSQESQPQEGEGEEGESDAPQGEGRETEREPEGDPIAERLLMKESEERQMRQAYQRRILRGRTAPARDW